jgi:putative oxidoreductase
MNAFVTVFYDWSRAVASWFSWLAPLAVRIVVGVVFTQTGWQKLNALPRMIQNFRDWGIPAPEILTPLASGIEFVGGLLLLVGLLTRFAAVPLMIVMMVAILSAKLGEIDSIVTLLGFEEVSYFVMFAWLAIAGPGPVSLDHFVLRAAGRKPWEHGA